MVRALWTLFKIAVVLALVAGVGLGVYLWRSGDPEYAAYELAFHNRFHRYDGDIEAVAKKRGIDPMLLKAVVWRESRFRPDKLGLDGERGLMQITNAAASEWVKGEKIANFVPTDLFDPKVNLEAGSWLIARALQRYEGRDNPTPFALAEYNAGRSRVMKWTGERSSNDGGGKQANSQELVANINIASTKRYIETVQNRARYYHQRGQL